MQKDENNDKENSRNFFWETEETITKSAENYYTEKWYKTDRWIIAMLILIPNLIFLLIMRFTDFDNSVYNLNSTSILFSLSIFSPLLYLIIRGYRIGYILTLILYIYDKIIMIQDSDKYHSHILWLIGVSALIINGLRIENKKIKLNLAKPYNIWKDGVIFFILISTLIAYTIIGIYNKEKVLFQDISYYKQYSFLKRDLTYELCHKYNVDLTGYKDLFDNQNKDMADEIENIEMFLFDKETINDEIIKNTFSSEEWITTLYNYFGEYKEALDLQDEEEVCIILNNKEILKTLEKENILKFSKHNKDEYTRLKSYNSN